MNKERLMKVLLSPIVTEKSSSVAEKARQIAFKVTTDASKPEIKAAVEMLFEVKVDNVRVLNNKGKEKRHGAMMGRRSDWKKAYVKLMPGHDINFGGGA
ncbi:MAG: 50S ribosomal protein L23 [Gammaproteobacteria bacterium RIFOXYA12_FULL_61_12]|nr:MAG: 50S ribosomal protein L23 [Gammaproteobacteria bacterium RIFOXYD12_FULL_61_37]OGT90478.1 MAG: 50S ribosomal protein L23 [Gammaproteobacteria bacterium RIFOXYA12_FULL_61_12]